MPLPQREQSESREDFIQRCLGDATMKSEFPNVKQRIAICNQQLQKDFKCKD
jgi:hypothetical protein